MISAAVMAGGKSRRMGQDKAWIDFEGRPIIARVIEVLQEVADEVFIVANDERYRTLGLRVVPDRFPDGGALGGIATGVGAAAHDRVLVADSPSFQLTKSLTIEGWIKVNAIPATVGATILFRP